MSELIKNQILIMWVMTGCGLTVGLLYDVFSLFRERFIKIKFLDITVHIISFVIIGYAVGEFIYFCNYGKITLDGIIFMMVGLWLWRKVFYDIIT